MKKIGIIGAGASGLFAAINLKKDDNEIYLIDKNDDIGKKLRITGNSRCNITNDKYYDEFLENIITNKKFLYSSFRNFDNYATMDYFKNKGLSLIIEDDGRVFPKSEKSQDVIDFFYKRLKEDNINIVLNTTVYDIIKNDKFLVKTFDKDYEFDVVIIATGGLSYKHTGSTGDGYKFARSLKHDVTNTYPSLVPIFLSDDDLFDIKALSLKDIKLSIVTDKKTYEDIGDILISRKLLTGPLILNLSSLTIKDKIKDIFIDLLPKFDSKNLEEYLINDFFDNPNKDISNILKNIIPSTIIPLILKRSKIEPYKKANQITKTERINLIKNIKKIHLNFDRFGNFDTAIITKGGVSIKDIDPKTMESKIIPNLFFIGEVLDIDALTGGYNLQIAFSTAKAAADQIKERL